MSSACTGEAVSYLRLERYLLQELPAAELARVDAHLASCPACRACLLELRTSDVALPPLPVAPSGTVVRAKPIRSVGTRVVLFGSGLALAAVAMLVLHGVLEQPVGRVRGSDPAIKGGELALELVRERDGDVARDPRSFVEGDRFAAFVTCTPGTAYWELVVIQSGQAFFPLTAAAPLACGNQVQLPGAFVLTGAAPALVCVLLARDHAIDRARIARLRPEALPNEHACRLVTPAGR